MSTKSLMLTDVLINSTQNYYGMAIRGNSGSVIDMARAIWASFCHTFPTDQTPNHDFCPDGPTSWCGWQKARAEKRSYSHTKSLSPAIRDAVKPIYVRLAETSLLERCTRGATQNANEAINSLIWQICPKELFCSAKVVETAVYLAVIIFNDGYEQLEAVLTEMACSSGTLTSSALQGLDRKKQYHKARKSSSSKQDARKSQRAQKDGVW
eukprot:scpid77962/ scgid14895/ 